MAEDEIENLKPNGEEHNPFEHKEVDEKMIPQNLKLLHRLWLRTK
jgi:hypothetical protein